MKSNISRHCVFKTFVNAACHTLDELIESR